MKRKELKQMAEKFAKLERIVQTSKNNAEVKQAQLQIMELSSHVGNLEDMVIIDEMVQKILETG